MARHFAVQLGFVSLMCGALGASQVLAQSDTAENEPFVPESPGKIETIAPGPYVYVNNQNWGGGASAVYIYDAADLTLRGSVSGGMQSHFTVSEDNATIYMVSGFYPRAIAGEGEHVLQIFDVATNTLTKEIVLPYKAARYTDDRALLQLSADEKLIYVQNATPATSVSVVNLEAGETIQEVPTPGCFGIYPALSGYSFSTICGNGTFMTFDLGDDGTTFESVRSEKIFDVDEDPIYLASDRVEGDLMFVSYNANLYRLSDADGVIKKLSVTPIADDIEGNWGTSGYSVLSYNDAHGVLFVSMAPDHHDGSHYHDAQEVWAYDVAADKLLYRSPVDGLAGIYVTDDDAPSLYGISIGESKVFRYALDPEAKFAAKKVAEHDDFGFATTLAGSL